MTPYVSQEKVQMRLERLFCDDCKEEMLATGVVNLCQPPKYPHRCVKCKKERSMPHRYPRLIAVDSGGEVFPL